MPTLSQFELLETRVMLLTNRVTRLESLERATRINGKDAAEAEAVAARMGYDGDVFVQSFKVFERRAIARELHKLTWSAGRIAKVMGCCEKTAARWIGAHGHELSRMDDETPNLGDGR